MSASINLSSSGVEGNDNWLVQYSLDGEPSVIIGSGSGSVNTNLTVSGLTGNTLVLEIYFYTSNQGDYYYADNIQVTGILANVVNPQDFSSNAVSTSQIDLSYTTNPANDDVVIVWNSTGVFSAPSGAPPAPGQPFAGGIMLSQGTLSPVSHIALSPNTQYFYKAWSYDGTEYSTGVTSNSTTLCTLITSFPWDEGFENGGIIPECWTQEYVSGDDLDWVFTAGAGNGGNITAPHSGSYNASLYDNDTQDDKTILVTPALDLSGYESATLTFWHAQEKWGNRQDELRVYYKNSESGPWTLLASYTSQFAAWTQQTIDLAGLSGTYYIGFEGNAKRARGVCIDDVSVGIPPDADFVADDVTPLVNQTVTFTDLSSFDPSSWNWSFTPNTVVFVGATSATSQNPQVEFTATGLYTVTLQATNAYGSDVETKTGYILAGTLVIWTGTTSADWNEGSNWSAGVVPTAGSDVSVPGSPSGGNFPETNSGPGAICENLTIEDGAHLYIPADNTLTVSGTLINNAGESGLVIQSDMNGTGSLLHDSDGVDATVRQYLSDDSWHYVSSPISNALSGVFLNIYLKPFNEPSDDWGTYIVPVDVPLNVMQGYAAWSYDPATVSFGGPMNNGEVSINVSCRDYDPGLGENGGWNLVGNPYPSAIDWNSDAWTKTNVDNTIYFWEGVGNGGEGNYHYYVGSGGVVPEVGLGFEDDGGNLIPPMQGFFVHASADGLLAVNNEARLHSDQAYWKASNAQEIPLIRLEAKSLQTGYSDESVIRFYPDATNRYDGQFDAYKLDGWMFPQLFSISEIQEELAVNTLPDYSNGMLVPLGFKSPESGTYSIELTQFDNFRSGIALYIEDMFEHTTHALNIGDVHEFMSTASDMPNRFMLHIVLSDADEDVPDLGQQFIYSYEKSVYVQIAEDSRTEIAIFNLMGQKVAEYSTADKGLFKAVLDCEPGYYVVRAQSNGDVTSEKVFIQ